MPEREKPPVPLWRWAVWWTILGVAVVVFYVLLTPLWLGLRAAAAGNALGRKVSDRADQSQIVDAAMAEEGLVLGGQERIPHQWRIFVEGELDAAFAGEGLDRRTVIAAHV